MLQMPYMYLLGHFKEPLRNKVRDFIIPKVRRRALRKRKYSFSDDVNLSQSQHPVAMQCTNTVTFCRSALPCCSSVSQTCPDASSALLNGGATTQVLKHLTIKRPLDAERLHFYAQASAIIV